MLKSQKLQKGFTIVELLIVIVVIGILAALVLNTVAGVQERARDTERQTDINNIATQLEVYYNDEGSYPAIADVTAANLPGMDEQALVAPGAADGTTTSLVAETEPDENEYGYITDGSTFTLYYAIEAEDGAIATKGSLN